MHADKIYKELVEDILVNGEEREDRTGVGTLSVFGRQCRYDLNEGFPILTTKKVHFKSVVGELLWFLRGDTNVKWLNDNGITIWDEWKDKNGDLGPVYGQQLRKWKAPIEILPPKLEQVYFADGTMADMMLAKPTPFQYYGDTTYTPTVYNIDQIKKVIHQIKTNPSSRRHIVTTWNPADIPKMALAPCHGLPIQFYVTNDKKLSCQVYIRSNDIFLGNPFNVASYALLTHMIAQITDMNGVKDLIVTIGDAHLYSNSIDAVKQQLEREPLPAPKLWLNPEIKDIDGFMFDDIQLANYHHHPAIKVKVAV